MLPHVEHQQWHGGRGEVALLVVKLLNDQALTKAVPGEECPARTLNAHCGCVEVRTEGVERTEELVDRGGDFVQIGPPGTRVLRGVHYVQTPSFRHGAAVLAVSRAFVGTEGGLHHAAAALGVPAVVLFSEFISPDITGYATHRNIRHAGATCGARIPCSSCRASMEAITVDEVEKHLKEITA